MRAALIGLGFAGTRLHLPSLRRLGAGPVIAADPDVRTHDRVGCPCVTDARDVLSEDPDLVVIASPPHTHADLALWALEKGLHAYVEKPMTTSLADARRLREAARGRTLQVGFAYRFHPLWQRVRALRDSGRLELPWDIGVRNTPAQVRAGWDAPCIDNGSHHLDLMTSLIGRPPSSVRATVSSLQAAWDDGTVLRGDYSPGSGVDTAVIRSGNARVSFDRFRGTRLRGRGIRLGSLALPDPRLAAARAIRSSWEISFGRAMASFLECAREGKAAGPGPEDGAVAVGIAEAILRSIESGGWEEVEAP